MALNVLRSTRTLRGPDGELVGLAEALAGAAYACRMGVFRKTLTLSFASPPEPSRLDSARRAAGGWRVTVRVDPSGNPPRMIDGGGTAGVREPRRPLSPSDSGRADPDDAAE